MDTTTTKKGLTFSWHLTSSSNFPKILQLSHRSCDGKDRQRSWQCNSRSGSKLIWLMGAQFSVINAKKHNDTIVKWKLDINDTMRLNKWTKINQTIRPQFQRDLITATGKSPRHHYSTFVIFVKNPLSGNKNFIKFIIFRRDKNRRPKCFFPAVE